MWTYLTLAWGRKGTGRAGGACIFRSFFQSHACIPYRKKTPVKRKLKNDNYQEETHGPTQSLPS